MFSTAPPSFRILLSQHFVQIIHGTINTFPGVRLLKSNYSNATEVADKNIHMNINHINVMKTYKRIPYLYNLSHATHDSWYVS